MAFKTCCLLRIPIPHHVTCYESADDIHYCSYTSSPTPDNASTFSAGSDRINKTVIYIGGVVPVSPAREKPNGWSSPGLLTGALLALRDINVHPGILSDYEVRLVYGDSHVGFIKI